MKRRFHSEMKGKNTSEQSSLPGRSSHGNMGQLRFLYPFLSPYKGQLFVSFVSLCLISILVLALGWGVRYLVDHGFAEESPYSLPQILCTLFAGVVILSIASFGRSYLTAFIGEKVAGNIRSAVFSHLLTLEMGFFEFVRPGELISRLTADVTLIHTLIGTCAAVALRNIALLAGGIVMMSVTSPQLTFYSLAIVPLILIPIILVGKRVQALSRQAQDAMGCMGDFLEETVNGIRACQAFGHEKQDFLQFNRHNDRGIAAAKKRLMMKGLLSSFVMILVFSGVGFIIGLGGYDVLNADLTPGDLCAFLFYAVTVAASAGSFSELVSDFHRAAGATERLNELLKTAPLITSPKNPRLFPASSQGVIALHNVNFAYPSNRDHWVLKNFTLSVVPGEKVAIVGPSGAGKSTILSLLLRFYDPQSGCVYIDGIDCREAALPALRSRISFVPQDPVIFSKTMYENILYACPSATEAEVWKAAEGAHLLDVIKALPQGIYTPLGHRGVVLSGGQKQRVAIARALLRKGAILLLDEATSALDAESEHMIQDSLKRLMSTRTTLVVAHRLATVLTADRIVVMNQGAIEAVGTHADLISEDGLYRRLATLQFIDSVDFYKKGKPPFKG